MTNNAYCYIIIFWRNAMLWNHLNDILIVSIMYSGIFGISLYNTSVWKLHYFPGLCKFTLTSSEMAWWLFLRSFKYKQNIYEKKLGLENKDIHSWTHKIMIFAFYEIKEKISVGYHTPFPHNELVHLPYIAVATNTGQTRRWRAASYNGSQYYHWTISLFCIH